MATFKMADEISCGIEAFRELKKLSDISGHSKYLPEAILRNKGKTY